MATVPARSGTVSLMVFRWGKIHLLGADTVCDSLHFGDFCELFLLSGSGYQFRVGKPGVYPLSGGLSDCRADWLGCHSTGGAVWREQCALQQAGSHKHSLASIEVNYYCWYLHAPKFSPSSIVQRVSIKHRGS